MKPIQINFLFAGLVLFAAASPHAAAQASKVAPQPAAAAPANAPAGSIQKAVSSPSSRSNVERQEIRAQLLPRRYTTIAAEIGAKVSKLPIAEGGNFRAGQALVVFDCSIQQAQMGKATAELDAAQTTYKANVRLAELNSVGLMDLDLSKAAADRARAEVAANQAVLSKCTIPAPYAGRVAEQKVREQQYAQAGQPLLEILDDSVLELEFLVPSSWLTTLRMGGAFKVEIDETKKSYPARLIRIGARVDAVSQSVKIAAAIDGRFPELVSGMSGRVRIPGMESP
ncbi:efflux RND transporter periplasmic adaptor subunit [Lacisediminimonas sp.]|uniref:efflux RND transporter periplasmic adaptor subunit n=1 Tax=Lacisediminimonas sp. TaxID=3060582 RepID=UPI002716FE0A|nr:efflux RND transporter periplasmic adaptor subunit [Lacisediminimonas sp.]MDO8299664.1 efflux RND transporter periplasmic adaptor subunit [Lacisediminimonas sp.]MDO9217429.1 efflux RND transporter periplasmic adaptor subunit [Lacisediminimonas sp.]